MKSSGDDFSAVRDGLTRPRQELLRDLLCGHNKSMEAWSTVNPLNLPQDDLEMIADFSRSGYCTVRDMMKIIKLDAEAIAFALSPAYRAMRHNAEIQSGTRRGAPLEVPKDHGRARVREFAEKAAIVIRELEEQFGPKSTWRASKGRHFPPDVTLFVKRAEVHKSKKPRF